MELLVAIVMILVSLFVIPALVEIVVSMFCFIYSTCKTILKEENK